MSLSNMIRPISRSLVLAVALLGIPFGDPYSMAEVSNDQSTAPTHIRRYCERALRGLDRYDFDIGGTMLDGRDISVVDCGDVIAECFGEANLTHIPVETGAYRVECFIEYLGQERGWIFSNPVYLI